MRSNSILFLVSTAAVLQTAVATSVSPISLRVRQDGIAGPRLGSRTLLVRGDESTNDQIGDFNQDTNDLFNDFAGLVNAAFSGIDGLVVLSELADVAGLTTATNIDLSGVQVSGNFHAPDLDTFNQTFGDALVTIIDSMGPITAALASLQSDLSVYQNSLTALGVRF